MPCQISYRSANWWGKAMKDMNLSLTFLLLQTVSRTTYSKTAASVAHTSYPKRNPWRKSSNMVQPSTPFFLIFRQGSKYRSLLSVSCRWWLQGPCLWVVAQGGRNWKGYRGAWRPNETSHKARGADKLTYCYPKCTALLLPSLLRKGPEVPLSRQCLVQKNYLTICLPISKPTRYPCLLAFLPINVVVQVQSL